MRETEDRPHHGALDDGAKSRHGQHGQRQADPVVEPELGDEGEREEATQHHQVALGEIDDFGGLVDEHEAERDQAVDAAERNAPHELLNEIQHAPAPNERRAVLPRLVSGAGA